MSELAVSGGTCLSICPAAVCLSGLAVDAVAGLSLPADCGEWSLLTPMGYICDRYLSLLQAVLA